MLRDRLAWGSTTLESSIYRLLAQGSLTFVKALEIAQASDIASCDLKDLQASGGGPTVNKVQKDCTMSSRQAQLGTVACLKCGGNHTSAHCQFRGKCRGVLTLDVHLNRIWILRHVMWIESAFIVFALYF